MKDRFPIVSALEVVVGDLRAEVVDVMEAVWVPRTSSDRLMPRGDTRE